MDGKEFTEQHTFCYSAKINHQATRTHLIHLVHLIPFIYIYSKQYCFIIKRGI